MSKPTKTTNVRTMRDAEGHNIPLKYVSKYDKTRDRHTRRILARFLKAREQLERCLEESLDDITAIVEAREQDVSARGNFQCQSFDGLILVSIDQAWHIRLDDRIREARDIILEYAKKLCLKAGSDAQALFEIVQEAFAANTSGGISAARVLSLCRRNITASEWVRAREMLLASITTDKGRSYLRVYSRPSTQHDWQMIRLDIADCWPLPSEATEEVAK